LCNRNIRSHTYDACSSFLCGKHRDQLRRQSRGLLRRQSRGQSRGQ
jgi:hypothetical protein